jgi:ABC-type transport system involved in multi-copper enzyme maturation permease subunit
VFGPVLSREAITLARRPRHYLARAACAAALLVLICTAWQVVTGTRVVRNTGDLARFNVLVFQVLAPLELVVCMFLSAISTALAVTQEKDRHTLSLLLLTRLANAELVLGQLAAGLLPVVSLAWAAGGVFLCTYLLGGVSLGQIMGTLLVTAATMLLCGSLGATMALWREKTFQTVGGTVLILVCWTFAWEALARGAWPLGEPSHRAAVWASRFSPWHAVLNAVGGSPGGSVIESGSDFCWVALLMAALLNGLSIWKVRAWNGASEAQLPRGAPDDESASRASEQPPLDRFGRQDAAAMKPGRVRWVWASPVVWREVRTWAYGRKVLAVRIVFVALVAAAALAVRNVELSTGGLSRLDAALRLVPLLVLGLLLINAQAVTSITNERDGQTLDLLLVTDITPGEFVGGKLAGVLYNTKEMVILPIALCGYLHWLGGLTAENLAYLAGGWLSVVVFAAVLGIHAGMSYANSRTAIAVSLGTLFFLVIGVATCMRIMVAFSGSFSFQLQPFLAAMVGGFVGLYLALGARNPSAAITAAALVCPLATLYALTSFLLGYTLAVFLVTTLAYGFAAAAMLVPAIYEFDLAERRPSGDEAPL